MVAKKKTAPRAAAPAAGFETVSAALRALFKPHLKSLVLKKETREWLYLDTPHLLKKDYPLHFGGVRLGKAYVSFYLMPCYTNPELLEGMSPALKKRMQGKSCFNFTAVEPALLKELGALTKAGFALYKKAGFLT